MHNLKPEQKRSWREWVADLFSGDPADVDELRQMLRDATQRGIVDGDALNIIYGAMQVYDMRARDIMIPHLPKREETVSVGRFEFRVLNADSRRIRLLQLNCH